MPPLLTSTSRRDGHQLAARHVSGPSTLRERSVRRRLRSLERRFARFFTTSREEATREGLSRLPSGGREWLLDNDFVVAEALETLKGALPAAFLSRLPGLIQPEEARGRPRVEVLAEELVRRERGRIEVDEVTLFLDGYQEIRPLRLAELWALPSFLRLALLEALLDVVTGGDEAEIGPFILSLRRLAGEDWRGVVESLSHVERILRQDPAGAYPDMDFRTRDRYRKGVEEVSRITRVEEELVAQHVLEAARAQSFDPREGHVGHYLVDEGRAFLFQELQGRVPLAGVPSRRRRWMGAFYFGGIAFLTLALLWVVAQAPVPAGFRIPLLLLSLIPIQGVAVALANRVTGQLVAPRPLPRLDMRRGIPSRFRTVVAVPVLLSSRPDVEGLVRTLETNYQANPDRALSFALVSDFQDADRERMEEDGDLLAAAVEGIRDLNHRYGRDGTGPFLLLHRPRRWNEAEGCWMGWERKRGKLAELNLLLLGRPSGLWVVEGDATRIEGAPFVITLDADTLMPRDAAARLVGTLAHPLNLPEVTTGGRVRRGYSVLQPRIEILPEPDGGSPFSRIIGGVQGLDLYAHAAFDVYQDLFDIGIFAGKGIYHVHAFESSLSGRTPENSLLSHDLFEGVHGRAGLVSDLILLEDFPSHPLAYARRAHRWTRGDWQILPWLFPRVPAEEGSSRKNRLSALARWKIADNLRRSLHAPVVLLLLLYGWVALPEHALIWTAAFVGVLGIPFLIGSVDAAFRAIREFPRTADMEAEARALIRAIGRWALEVMLLPFEAWNSLDAIVRTLYRVYFSRKGLLEWTTAAATGRALGRGATLRLALSQMWVGPVLALGAFGLWIGMHGAVSIPILAILMAWAASPVVAHRISRPWRPIREPKGEFPRGRARVLSRRIWGYYERFQGPERHWLAPDHFQEAPGGEVAHRTSPTNLGMAMMAAVTAWDLGFVGTSRFITQIRNTVDGMSRLTRYRGHFLNWYDTSNLEPLHPMYVSTVDSGNLAAAFIVAREALSEARSRPIWKVDRVEGLADTTRVISELLSEMTGDGGAQALLAETVAVERWIERNVRGAWEEGIQAYAGALEELRDRVVPELQTHLLRIHEGLEPEDGNEAWSSVHAWMEHLKWDVEQSLGGIHLFLPWLGPPYRGSEAASALHRRITASPGGVPSLTEMEALLAQELELREAEGEGANPDSSKLTESLRQALLTVRLLLDDVTRLVEQLESWYEEMDFRFLYDERRDLFRIGFSVSAGELDPNHYDLLASEARIASLVGISKGDAPPAHWLHLGRPFTWTRRGPVLLSWAGTMFEYLMPSLVLRTPPESVLEEGCRRAVEVQRDHGKRTGTPWGISESGYHVLSPEGHYQYRAFGVPVLGLRRNTGSRHVVAPYASLMAVGIAPGATFENLGQLVRLGGMGPWGPYEALDFGKDVQWKGAPRVVRSYMSHHHGMILAAFGGYLTGNRNVDRFHRDPRIATVEPYLYERIPWRRSVGRKWVDRSVVLAGRGSGPELRDWAPSPDRLPPPTHHLASGTLVVGLGPDGRGGSRWGDWSIVRGGVGQGMPVGGPDLLIKDLATGVCWRPLPDPSAPAGEDQQILFEPHRAEFMRKSREIRARMDVILPPDSEVEVRHLVLSSESSRPRHLRVAVSAELALAPFMDDLRHPAFHKLFVRAEALPEGEGLLFERRPRGPKEKPPVLLVTVVGTDGTPTPGLRWGTSREAFLGRSGNRDRPAALDDPLVLTNPTQPHHPLDPMASAVLDVELEPWGDVALTFLLTVGPDRETVIQRASELRSPGRREWARIQARARAEGELLRLDAEGVDPVLWEELLSHVLHPRSMWAGGVDLDPGLDLRQSTLWRWGISGDVPIILIEEQVEDDSHRMLAGMIRAQRWWRARGLKVDLVVLGHGVGDYQDLVRERVRTLLSSAGAEESLGRPGGVHLVAVADLVPADLARLNALAAFTVSGTGGGLERQLQAARPLTNPLPPLARLRLAPSEEQAALVPNSPGGKGEAAESGEVEPVAMGDFDPETGGFRIRLGGGETTPAPWSNIVARDTIGFLVTESGGSFTWVEDAGEFRLTPWNNDPLLGLQGEAVYLRDEEVGRVWTPCPGPLGLTREHDVVHGWGHTRLQAGDRDLQEELSWSLHPELPVKVVRVRLRNEGERARRISVSMFVDWVLGPHPVGAAGRLQTRYDAERAAVLARNPFSDRFHDRLAFLASDGRPDGMATDRQEFLGSSGPFDRVPLGLHRILPGERATPEGPACGVLKRTVAIAPGEEATISFFLGAASTPEELDSTLAVLRGTETREVDLSERAQASWQEYLGRVHVSTPDPGLDALMNGWLPYQTVTSRLRGRTGYYQSGGAFGFRDQLQDVYTLLPLDPGLAADHLEEAARRQFVEGDVLHWWHPGTTRGVRTRCSDDLLWLPWVLAQTVIWTGDRDLLDRTAPFLEGKVLGPGEDEHYDAFSVTREVYTLLEHGLRAAEQTARSLSDRGLPLIGTGDWNDGMDRVGREGKGESIWLGWFFLDTCRLLLPLAREGGEDARANRLESACETVRKAIEAHGWDGEWYRRAFFDDGAPIGSRDSSEARIDSIAQSWAVISGAADPARARSGLESAWRELVRTEDGIILLLSPPFEGRGPDPGYIAAYPPGVRENGGQYTHAATWLIRAFARVGDGERAGALLRLLLPTRHGEGERGRNRYRVEPYVVAADVYGVEPHVGRGGWTWYTGSAGWVWRVVLEDILGVRREGDTLRIDPCVPPDWEGFRLALRLGGVSVELDVENPDRVAKGIRSCTLDGVDVDPEAIPLPAEAAWQEGGSGTPREMRIRLVLG